MFDATLKARPALSLVAVAAVAVLAGCTMPNRDSVTVGAIPDDYRTNHPIVIAEKEQVLDLPVGASDRGMTKMQRTALSGFLSNYDRSADPVLNILTPSGSLNELAASHAASDFANLARRSGVPASRIVVSSYQATSADSSEPVRITYAAMKAQTNKCGRWPEDLVSDTSENKHYANFGCSYQNNLAAQVANPADLLGPRKPGEIDATRRGVVIDDYRSGDLVDTGGSEVNY
jgi:pilus assembly protein CpaD